MTDKSWRNDKPPKVVIARRLFQPTKQSYNDRYLECALRFPPARDPIAIGMTAVLMDFANGSIIEGSFSMESESSPFNKRCVLRAFSMVLWLKKLTFSA